MQHSSYVQSLSAISGVQARILPAHPDACFVEDTVIALPEAIILCRPGAISRQGETMSIAQVLPKDRPLCRIDGPATIEGGDVLRDGRNLG